MQPPLQCPFSSTLASSSLFLSHRLTSFLVMCYQRVMMLYSKVNAPNVGWEWLLQFAQSYIYVLGAKTRKPVEGLCRAGLRMETGGDCGHVIHTCLEHIFMSPASAQPPSIPSHSCVCPTLPLALTAVLSSDIIPCRVAALDN
jgi:hypothetical protein